MNLIAFEVFMQRILLSFLLCSSVLAVAGEGLPLPETLPLQEYANSKIIFNNSIITKINGKAISALDVKKRLDFIFNQQFADLASSESARYEFYKVNWPHVLKEALDRELILADAMDKGLPISDGDIRQELEDLFGPNVVEAIDKLGMTYDEAWEMIRNDIAIRRMMIYRVHQKAQMAFSPEDVFAVYQEHIEDLTSPSKWTYRVLSIRHEDAQKAGEYAQEAYKLLTENSTSAEDLSKVLLERFGNDNPSFSAKLSSKYDHTDKTLSESHRAVLSDIDSGSFSEPIAQSTRKDASPVFRIFFLEDYVPGQLAPFDELEDKIKNRLLDMYIAEETTHYLDGLKHRFGLDNDDLLTEALSDTSTPFVLQ
ncbi:Uncharacterized protein SCG7109_AP_00050 [Chlamydiales bacterium SCGC AG-110-M15]|nr:Uncharacterized protein SCG7109_AP_00050 [Chlamydiales bacterium SCGC AG-110-M15]